MNYKIYNNFEGWNFIASTTNLNKMYEILLESFDAFGDVTHIVVENNNGSDFPILIVHRKKELKEVKNEHGKVYAKHKL